MERKYTKYDKYLSPAFMVISVIGTVALPIITAKTAPKAAKKRKEAEEIKGDKLTITESIVVEGPVWTPVGVLTAVTVVCQVSGRLLDRKAQNSLTAAYMALDQYHKAYRQEVIDTVGVEEEKHIMKAAQARCIRYDCNFHELYVDEPDTKTLWRLWGDPYEEYFQRYEREVVDAEYHLNRNYILGGCASMNDFRNFLGLGILPKEQDLFWDIASEIYWIDIEHILLDEKGPNGEDVYLIAPVFAPETWEYIEENY